MGKIARQARLASPGNLVLLQHSSLIIFAALISFGQIVLMEAKLVVVGGDAKPSEINLKLPSTIGRGRDATLTLPHPLVSRQHCRIYEHEGQLMVRDLGSLNGTFIGRERITEAVLPPGELLTVGTVTFRAVYEAPEGVFFEEDDGTEEGFYEQTEEPGGFPDFANFAARNDVGSNGPLFENAEDEEEVTENLPETDEADDEAVEFEEEELDEEFDEEIEEDFEEEVAEEDQPAEDEPEEEDLDVVDDLEDLPDEAPQAIIPQAATEEMVESTEDDLDAEESIEELDLDEIEDIEELMELEEVEELEDFIEEETTPPLATEEEVVEMFDETETLDESEFMEEEPEVEPEPSHSPGPIVGPPPGDDSADQDDDDLSSFLNNLK